MDYKKKQTSVNREKQNETKPSAEMRGGVQSVFVLSTPF